MTLETKMVDTEIVWAPGDVAGDVFFTRSEFEQFSSQYKLHDLIKLKEKEFHPEGPVFSAASQSQETKDHIKEEEPCKKDDEVDPGTAHQDGDEAAPTTETVKYKQHVEPTTDHSPEPIPVKKVEASPDVSAVKKDTESGRREQTETKSGRCEQTETKSGRCEQSETKSGRSEQTETKSGRCEQTETKSGRCEQTETKSGRSEQTETKSGRREQTETKSVRCEQSETKSGRSEQTETRETVVGRRPPLKKTPVWVVQTEEEPEEEVVKKFAAPHNAHHPRFPRSSALTMEEHKSYLELQKKYGGPSAAPHTKTVSEVKEFKRFKGLCQKVTAEQEEFLIFTEAEARRRPGAYRQLHPEAASFTQEYIDSLCERVANYHRFYVQHDNVPLIEKHVSFVPLVHVKCLLQLGVVPLAVLPNLETICKPRLPRDHDRVANMFPPSKNKDRKPSCSMDNNAEKLATKYAAEIVISASTIKCILDHGVSLERQWELPVVIKEHVINDERGKRTQKVVYLDKPFPPRTMLTAHKNSWYHKFAMKTSILHRKHKSCHIFSDRPPKLEGYESDVDDISGNLDDLETFGVLSEKSESRPSAFKKYIRPDGIKSEQDKVAETDEHSESSSKMDIEESPAVETEVTDAESSETNSKGVSFLRSGSQGFIPTVISPAGPESVAPASSDSLKPEEQNVEVSKTPDASSDSSKLEELNVEVSKTPDASSDSSKLEEQNVEVSKTPDASSDSSKLEELNVEESKTPDASSDSSKLEELNVEESKTPDVSSDDSKLEEQNVEESKKPDSSSESSKLQEQNVKVSKTPDPSSDDSKLEKQNVEESKKHDSSSESSKLQEQNVKVSKTPDPSSDGSKLEDQNMEESKTPDTSSGSLQPQQQKAEESNTSVASSDSHKPEQQNLGISNTPDASSLLAANSKVIVAPTDRRPSIIVTDDSFDNTSVNGNGSSTTVVNTGTDQQPEGDASETTNKEVSSRGEESKVVSELELATEDKDANREDTTKKSDEVNVGATDVKKDSDVAPVEDSALVATDDSDAEGLVIDIPKNLNKSDRKGTSQEEADAEIDETQKMACEDDPAVSEENAPVTRRRGRPRKSLTPKSSQLPKITTPKSLQSSNNETPKSSLEDPPQKRMTRSQGPVVSDHIEAPSRRKRKSIVPTDVTTQAEEASLSTKRTKSDESEKETSPPGTSTISVPSMLPKVDIANIDTAPEALSMITDTVFEEEPLPVLPLSPPPLGRKRKSTSVSDILDAEEGIPEIPFSPYSQRRTNPAPSPYPQGHFRFSDVPLSPYHQSHFHMADTPLSPFHPQSRLNMADSPMSPYPEALANRDRHNTRFGLLSSDSVKIIPLSPRCPSSTQVHFQMDSHVTAQSSKDKRDTHSKTPHSQTSRAQDSSEKSTVTCKKEKEVADTKGNVTDNSDGKATKKSSAVGGQDPPKAPLSAFDQIMQAQESFLKTPAGKVENPDEVPVPHPVPSTEQAVSSHSASGVNKDPAEWEPAENPEDYETYEQDNLTYNLWLLGDLRVIVRCGIHGLARNKRKSKLVSLTQKMEHQPNFGFEQVTPSECARSWVDLHIRNVEKLLRVRVNAMNSEVMRMDHVTMADVVNAKSQFNPLTAIKGLHSVLEKLRSLPVGDYLLGHSPGNAHAHIKRGVSTTSGVYDLHKVYLENPVGNIKDDWLPWIPIDPTLQLFQHRKQHRIPATFVPKDSPDAKMSTWGGKAGGKSKRQAKRGRGKKAGGKRKQNQ